MARITVVGGANLDVQGFVAADLRPHDSNPGRVRSSPGGVGRNIAENLARLGHSVTLVSAVGDDAAGAELLRGLEAVGVDTQFCLRAAGRSTSHYLCILDRSGGLHAAVSDMEVLEALGPAEITERENVLRGAELCVFDTNLERAALEAAVALCQGIPCVLDTVSVAKAGRAGGCIGSFAAAKPNVAELEVLAGFAVVGDRALDRAVEALHERGTERLFVSLGGRGLYYSGGGRRGVVAPPPTTIVNVSGAGDALTAALADRLVTGSPIDEAASFAVAAGAIATESEAPVSDALTEELVRRRAAFVRYTPR